MTSYDRPGSLDGAIDRAVREMMSMDPRPGFRHRVAHAIKTPARGTFGVQFGLGAFGLVMIGLIALMIWRPSDTAAPVHVPQVAVATPAAPAVPHAEPQAVETPLPRSSAAGPAPARPRARVTPTPTPESIFGPRQGTVAAASVPSTGRRPAATAFWLEVPADAARWSALTPVTFQPMMVVPLAVQPLFVRGLSPRK